jgi:predicted PurR-regulated permease PerM
MSRFHTTILLLIAIAVLYVAKEVFIPLALAGVISMLLTGPVSRLERLRVPRPVAVTLCVVVTFGLMGLIGWVVGMQIVSLAEEMPRYRTEIVAKANAIRGGGGALEKGQEGLKIVQQVMAPTPESEPVPTSRPASQPATGPATNPAHLDPKTVMKETFVPTPPPPLALDPAKETKPDGSKAHPVYAVTRSEDKSPLEQLWTWLGFVLSPLGTIGIVIVFVIFILLEREDLRDRMIRLVSQGRYTVTTTAVDDGVTRVLKFLRAQAIVNGSYGLAVALGLWIIGFTLGHGTSGNVFPSFLLWGLLACLLRFIPYIGPWIAAVFPLTLALIVYPGFGVFGGVVCLFLVIELLSNNIMEPILYGTTTGLSTMAILVSAVFWTWLWGPVGLLLSTPLTVCAMVVGRYAPPLRFLEVLLGDRPAMSPPERVYQRLLAGDLEEALEVASKSLDEDGLLKTYDDVVLPALAMSENDTAEGLLGEEREHDVRDGMRQLIEALGQKAAEQQTARLKKEADNSEPGPLPAPAPVPSTSVRIAILPAHDEADEIAGLMLTHLLKLEGDDVLNVSHNALAAEMVDSVTQFDPHVMMISATPPAAVSHVRYLLRRFTDRMPPDRVAIGVWSARTDAETLRRRLDYKEQNLCTTLHEARDIIHKLTELARHATVTT